jgi:hypothetical protein
MAKKRAVKKKRVILVEADGTVKATVTVKPRIIEKVKWLPEIEGEEIKITFADPNDLPFSDWSSATQTGPSIVGTLKGRTDQKSFEYVAKGFQRNQRPTGANPELIVDGGGRPHRQRPRR